MSKLARIPPTYVRSVAMSSISTYEFQVENSNGIPVSLSCVANASIDEPTNVTRQRLDSTIVFDYELTLRDPMEGIVEVLKQDLPQWEFFVLYYVAEETGVLECDFEMQNVSNFSSGNGSGASGNAVDVVSLSSYGTDVIDDRVDTCEFLMNVPPGFICIPLQGTMKAEYMGSESDRDAVEEFLAFHVASVIDRSDFLGIGVNGTKFVGSRVIPSPPPINDETRTVDDDTTNESVIALATSLTVGAAFIMFIVYFAFARRRRRRTETNMTKSRTSNEKEIVLGTSVDDDLPTSPVGYTPTKSIDSKSISDEEKSDDAHCGSLVDFSSRLGREVLDSNANVDTITAAYSLTNIRTASTAASTEASDDNDSQKTVGINKVVESEIITTIAEPQHALDNLPPKHPTGPSAKPPVPPTAVLKVPKAQRRRKKKKKKTTTLVRSNSRENIKEMETITEVEEETSGDNIGDASDDGSWCSTSDSEPGSRDPSPARSSRNSSREASPARSTGSGSGGNDRDNVNVGAGTMTPSWNTTTRIGPSPDATSGTEKPKPNRLPPSWI